MLDSMSQKKSTRVEPHYMDVWLPTHDDDEAMVEKLISNNIKYMHNLLYIRTNSIFCTNDIQKS
jgi:hypothetical protein